jgi:protein phosphatase
MGAGCAAAIVTALLRMNGLPGAPLFFLLAAGLVGAGVVGLVIELLREPPPGAVEVAAEAPRELRVYKTHDCAVTAELTEAFAQLEASLSEGMRGQGVPADFAAHAQLAGDAEAAAAKPDPLDAFRARCASLLFLAEAFHKARHKQESFQPNWTPGQPRA